MLIRKLRLQKGWSQEHLAEISGLSVRTIQRLERGQTASMESKNALASVFEIDRQQLEEEQTMTSATKPDSNSGITVEEAEAIEYVKELKGFFTHLFIFVVVNLALLLLNLFLTPEFLWFWIAFLGWGFGLLGHASSVFEIFNLFSPGWERKKIEERLGRKL